MHPRRASARCLAVFAALLPFWAGGCRQEAQAEPDFFYPANPDIPLTIRVNSKSEVWLHGKWVPIFEKPKTVDLWFQRQAERYRQAYELNDVKLPKKMSLGKEKTLMPTEVVIEVDHSTIKSGIVNSMKRRAKEVGFVRPPKMVSLDPNDQKPAPPAQ